jgi:hypothetical protein
MLGLFVKMGSVNFLPGLASNFDLCLSVAGIAEATALSPLW